MIIETKRLILRAPVESDIQDIVSCLNDIEVLSALGPLPFPYMESDALDFVSLTNKWGEEQPRTNYSFVLESKEDGRVVGQTSIHITDYKEGIAATGSWLRRSHWRQGFMLEAKIAVLDYCFSSLSVKLLKTSAYLENVASQKMSLKLGYRETGMSEREMLCRATGIKHRLLECYLSPDNWRESRKHLLRM